MVLYISVMVCVSRKFSLRTHAPYALKSRMPSGRLGLLGVRRGQEIPAHLVPSPPVSMKKLSLPEVPIAKVAEALQEEKKEEVKKEEKAVIHVVEVPDVLFHLGSPVPLLDEQGRLVGAVATAILYAKNNSAERLIVCGHADTTGEPPRNTRSRCSGRRW